MRYWGQLGAFWGVPGDCSRALQGAVVTGGHTVIGAGLLSIGVPKDSVLQYEMAIKANQFLLVAHRTADEATRAKRVLRITGPRSIEMHTFGIEQPCTRA